MISSCVRSFRYDLCAITDLGEAESEINFFHLKLYKQQVHVCYSYVQYTYISIQTASTMYSTYQTSMKCLFYVACCLSAAQNGCQEAVDIS